MPKKSSVQNNQDLQLLQNEESGQVGQSEPLGKQKKMKKIIIYESDDEDNENESVDDKAIEAPKVEPPKQKRQPTEKQLEALKAGNQKRRDNERMIREQKEKQRELEQKQLEEKIVKKALSIKKKQIKKEAVLDNISDDETPIEHIKQIVKRTAKKDIQKPEPQPIKPKYYFV